MGTAYTPGLSVNGRALIQKIRRLPIKGEVLVEAGQQVEPDTVIARTDLPGDVTLLRAGDRLGVPGGELVRLVSAQGKEVGSRVAAGDLLAETPGLFGRFFKSRLQAPVSGTIELITERTGNISIRHQPKPVALTAYVRGTIAEVMPEEGAVVETRGALVQGIFGIGGERCGRLVVLDRTDQDQLSRLRDPAAGEEGVGRPSPIVVVPGRVDVDFYQAAAEAGAVGVVAGSILDVDLRTILGHDIGVAITGEEDVPATLIVTEGFGDVAMAARTHRLMQSVAGREASISGATQIRAGVIRPEIIVPDLSLDRSETVPNTAEDQVLDLGTPIRLIREPYFGRLGKVSGLPAEPVVIGSGARVRVLEAELDDGAQVTVPRANVEIVLT